MLLTTEWVSSKPKPERCGGKHQPRCLAFSTKSPRRAADALLGAIESAGTRRTLRLPTVKKQLGRRGAAWLSRRRLNADRK